MAALFPQLDAAPVSLGLCKTEEREVRELWKPAPEREQILLIKGVCSGGRQILPTLGTWRGKCFTPRGSEKPPASVSQWVGSSCPGEVRRFQDSWKILPLATVLAEILARTRSSGYSLQGTGALLSSAACSEGGTNTSSTCRESKWASSQSARKRHARLHPWRNVRWFKSEMNEVESDLTSHDERNQRSVHVPQNMIALCQKAFFCSKTKKWVLRLRRSSECHLEGFGSFSVEQ